MIASSQIKCHQLTKLLRKAQVDILAALHLPELVFLLPEQLYEAQ